MYLPENKPHALRMALRCEVTVKIIDSKFSLSSLRGDEESKAWSDNLMKLADLTSFRQPKLKKNKEFAASITNNPAYLFNTKTGAALSDPPKIDELKSSFNQEKFIPGETQFTSNTSTTLLPADGNIRLFGSTDDNYVVGIGFSIRHAHLNNEYFVFQHDAFTDLLWWEIKEHRQKAKFSISINKLISEERLFERVSEIRNHNELYIGLNASAACCICLQPGKNRYKKVGDELYFCSRFDAIFRKQMFYHKFQRHLPIILVDTDTDTGISEYTIAQQKLDLNLYLKKNPHNAIVNDLMNHNEKIGDREMYYGMQGIVDQGIINLKRKINDKYQVERLLVNIQYQTDRDTPEEMKQRLQRYNKYLDNILNEILTIKNQLEKSRLDPKQRKQYDDTLEEERKNIARLKFYSDLWCPILWPLRHRSDSPEIINNIVKLIEADPSFDKESLAKVLLLYIQNRMTNHLPDDKSKTAVPVQLCSRKLQIDNFSQHILDVIENAKISKIDNRYRDALFQIKDIIDTKYLKIPLDPRFINDISDEIRQFYIELKSILFDKIDSLNYFYADRHRYSIS